MLLSSALGGTAGLAYHNMQVHSIEYNATATVAIEDPKWLEENRRPGVVVRVESGARRDAKEAINSAGLMIHQIGTYIDAPIMIRDLEIDRNVDGKGWWKATILGAIFAILLAIGGIYVWEDARPYLRQQQESP